MPKLAELSVEERERALSRFRLLAPHVEARRELRTVADGPGVCFRTLQRRVAQYPARTSEFGEHMKTIMLYGLRDLR